MMVPPGLSPAAMLQAAEIAAPTPSTLAQSAPAAAHQGAAGVVKDRMNAMKRH